MEKEKIQENTEMDFNAYGRSLTIVTSFKYLGRFLTAADDNWKAVVGNIWKERKSLALLERILGWEGAIPLVSGMLFKAVVQAVLLFGLETRVTKPCIGKSMGSFQHRFPGGLQGDSRSNGGGGELGVPNAGERNG